LDKKYWRCSERTYILSTCQIREFRYITQTDAVALSSAFRFSHSHRRPAGRPLSFAPPPHRHSIHRTKTASTAVPTVSRSHSIRDARPAEHAGEKIDGRRSRNTNTYRPTAFVRSPFLPGFFFPPIIYRVFTQTPRGPGAVQLRTYTRIDEPNGKGITGNAFTRETVVTRPEVLLIFFLAHILPSIYRYGEGRREMRFFFYLQNYTAI